MTHSRRIVESRRTLLLVVTQVLLVLSSAHSLPADDSPSASETSARTTLSARQSRAIELLKQVRPTKPAPLFLFTDPNKDPDDLSVLIETKYLHEQGFVDLKCVVTTLGDREVRTKRARFVRCVLDDLGLKQSRVGVGVDYAFEVKDARGAVDLKATQGRTRDHQVFVETPLLRSEAVVEQDGLALLNQELQQVPDQSAVLVANAGMSDLAEVLRTAPDLVRQKVAQVVIMGGVESRVDQRGFLVADKRAYNNSTHQPSADFAYAKVQELGLTLIVVNKEATYSAAAPRSFYDSIAATRHPVGVYLKAQQKESLRHLWQGIHLGHLPPALTPEWFFKTFTDVDLDSPVGKESLAHAKTNADDFEAIWNQVSKFNLYDPLALLAATPGAGEMLFRVEIPAGATTKVQIIGKNSIKDSMLIKDLLVGIGIESLRPPKLEKSSE